MKVVYTSNVFKDANGTPRKFLIPADAVKTYQKRDEYLQKMIELGGIFAKPTAEFLGYRSKMLAARKKIERMGWHSILVDA